jgi:hypothetical protein
MRHAMGIGRIAGLAVGLGIGAALATPGVASADPSTDPWIEQLLGGLSVPVPAATLDMQISIDGMDLFPTAGNTATADSAMGDIAIAIGNGSLAESGAGIAFGEGLTPGQFDIAVADGTGSFATSGEGNFDSAFADGTAIAVATGFNGVSSNGDFSAAVGNGAQAQTGTFTDVPSQNNVALAFDPSGTVGNFAAAGDGNLDLASVFGANSLATAYGDNFLAAVFGDGLTATATAANPIEIVPSLLP